MVRILFFQGNVTGSNPIKDRNIIKIKYFLFFNKWGMKIKYFFKDINLQKNKRQSKDQWVKPNYFLKTKFLKEKAKNKRCPLV